MIQSAFSLEGSNIGTGLEEILEGYLENFKKQSSDIICNIAD
jgi:hypothetical protein